MNLKKKKLFLDRAEYSDHRNVMLKNVNGPEYLRKKKYIFEKVCQNPFRRCWVILFSTSYIYIYIYNKRISDSRIVLG